MKLKTESFKTRHHKLYLEAKESIHVLIVHIFLNFLIISTFNLHYLFIPVTQYDDGDKLYEPVRVKTNNLGFRPGPTQTGLHNLRSILEH